LLNLLGSSPSGHPGQFAPSLGFCRLHPSTEYTLKMTLVV
jgi:hypothetical protein